AARERSRDQERACADEAVMLCHSNSWTSVQRVIPLSCRQSYRDLGVFRYRFSVKNAAKAGLISVSATLFVAHENLALAGVIRRAHDAFQFHALHQRSSAVVADLQAALDVGSRGLLVALDDR